MSPGWWSYRSVGSRVVVPVGSAPTVAGESWHVGWSGGRFASVRFPCSRRWCRGPGRIGRPIDRGGTDMDDPRTPGERAADEWAGRNVISRLALYAEGVGTLEESAALFTEDGEWLMPTGPIQGRDNTPAGARPRREAGGVGPGSNSRHMIT